jgi:hypothetical protein
MASLHHPTLLHSFPLIDHTHPTCAGLYKEPIFLAVIIITLGLQAIIINFLGTFFKVRGMAS